VNSKGARVQSDVKKSSTKPLTIAEYLAPLDAQQRAALQKLRKAIAAAAPDSEETISYSMPAFRYQGRVLVYFFAATHHCSFFPGAYPIEAHKADLTAYSTSKGTIRFPPDAPLPVTLVRKLVKTRLAELTETRPAATRAARSKLSNRSSTRKAR
jgi:uncharacterized protein YdhG (YjbR/CyaY superfamily)